MKDRVLPWAFGFAPVLLLLVTWSSRHQDWWIKTYALPVVAVEMATVVVAFQEGMRLRLNAVTAGLVALLLIAWVTALIAPNPAAAMFRTGFWTVHLLFGFAAARLFRAEDLTDGLLAGFMVFVAIFAVFVLNAPADFNWIYDLPGLGNIRRFSYYAAAAIGLCLGTFAAGRRWTVAVAAVAFALVFWSGSRGAAASAAVGLGASLFLFPTVRKPRAWGSFLVSALLGATIAKLIGSPKILMGVSRMVDAGDNGRFEGWHATINLIKSRPWFGYGEGQMEGLAHLPFVTQPHNVVLQLLLAWGVVGCVLALTLLAVAARRMLRQADEHSLPLLCAAIILTAYAMIDGTLYHVHPVAIFAACVGVAMAPRLEISTLDKGVPATAGASRQSG